MVNTLETGEPKMILISHMYETLSSVVEVVIDTKDGLQIIILLKRLFRYIQIKITSSARNNHKKISS